MRAKLIASGDVTDFNTQLEAAIADVDASSRKKGVDVAFHTVLVNGLPHYVAFVQED